MAETTIRSLFWGSLVAFGGALVLLAVAGALALANGSLVKDGPDVTGIRETPFGWVMAGLAAVAVVVMLAAAVTQFVAWVGAVINTAGLKDKTWFIILLVTGPDDSPPVHARPAAHEAPPRNLRSRSA